MKSTTAAILAAIALACGLAGCSPDPTKGPAYPVVGTVDQVQMEKSADIARTTFAGLAVAGAEYVSLPRCQTGVPQPCSSQSAVYEIRRDLNAANVATKGAADIAHSPTKTSSALANAVSDANRANDVLRATLAKFNASKGA
jgi:hypothetical protein